MSASLLSRSNLPAPSATDADGLVYVSIHHLIQLRHVAQSLSLNVAKVRALQTGQYYSPFRGRGMEFDEVRLYQPGDDVRTLDWRVTARTGKAHTKLFREERERSVFLWVDFRAPMFFATRGVFKSVMAATTATMFAWSAHNQRDRVGGLLFSDDHHHELRPRSGKSAVLHLLQQLSQLSQWQLGKSVSNSVNRTTSSSCYDSLMRLRRVTRPGSLIFLISDFRGFDRQSESVLTQIARHNDVVLLMVHDALEAALPQAGVYRVGNGQLVIPIDTANHKAVQHYQQQFRQRMDSLKTLCKVQGMNFISLATHEQPLAVLKRNLYLTQKPR